MIASKYRRTNLLPCKTGFSRVNFSMTELIVTVPATKSLFTWHLLRFWGLVIGDRGSGTGDWVLGIGDWGLGNS